MPSTFQVVADAVIAFFGVGASGAGAYAALMSYRTRKHVQEIHVQINSRMDELLATTHALGDAEGRAAHASGNGAASG